MCSINILNPVAIFELLQQSGARALIYEPSFGVNPFGCPVSTHPVMEVPEQDVADVGLPSLWTNYSASDLVFIFHTSGSTGGRPKLVPYNRRLLDSAVAKAKQMARVLSTQGQDVTVAM